MKKPCLVQEILNRDKLGQFRTRSDLILVASVQPERSSRNEWLLRKGGPTKSGTVDDLTSLDHNGSAQSWAS